MSIVAQIKKHPSLVRLLAGPNRVRRKLLYPGEGVINAILNRLGDIVQTDVILRVDEFSGNYWLSPRSDLFKRYVRDGFYEPDLRDLYLKHIKPDADILDIGANIGFFAVSGAQRLTSGRLLAVEPVPAAFERLQKNVELNKVSDRVILFNGLAAASSGETSINVVEGREEYSSVGSLVHPSVAGASVKTHLAVSATVDQLVSQHALRPSLMKVDVEGAEAIVFAGAAETLNEYRPVVVSELSDVLLRNMGSSSAEVVAMFERAGYRVIDPKAPGERPGSVEFGDILCLPPGFQA